MAIGSFTQDIDSFIYRVLEALEGFCRKENYEKLVNDTVRHYIEKNPTPPEYFKDIKNYTFDINKWNPRFMVEFPYDPQNPPHDLQDEVNYFNIPADEYLLPVPDIPENVDKNMLKFADLMITYPEYARDKETLDGYDYFYVKEDINTDIIISMFSVQKRECIRMLVQNIGKALYDTALFDSDCLDNPGYSGYRHVYCSLEQTEHALLNYIEDAKDFPKESYLQKIIEKYNFSIIPLKEFLVELCI